MLRGDLHERRRLGRDVPRRRSVSTPACSVRSARLAAVDGGFVVSGQYQFGSGCAHATWFGAGVQEVDAHGEAMVDDIGLPAMRVVFLRPDQVELQGNWDVLGLAGTGSYDYEVDEQFVEAGFTFPLLAAEARRGGAGYGIGLFGLVAAGHAGFALGVGKRALAEILELAPTKARMGGPSVATEQLFQHDFAMHDAAMRAARAYVLESFADAEATVLGGRFVLAGTATAPAPGHDVRNAGCRRRGPVRIHVGGHVGVAQRRRAPALLP